MATAPNHKNLSDKIRALQKKTRENGCTEHEEQAAQEKASAIMKAHGIVEVLPDDYDALVRLGKEAVQKHDSTNWRLGELAARVETVWGEASLYNYAEAINIDYGILKDCCTTYKAWSQKAGRPAFYTARVLNPHPNRFKIITDNPNISYRKAQEIMRAWRHPERPVPLADEDAPENPPPVDCGHEVFDEGPIQAAELEMNIALYAVEEAVEKAIQTYGRLKSNKPELIRGTYHTNILHVDKILTVDWASRLLECANTLRDFSRLLNDDRQTGPDLRIVTPEGE